MRLFIGMIMIISSSLAINMFAAKEIRDAENRLRNDLEYKMWQNDYNQKMKIYRELNLTIQRQTEAGYEHGARKARIQRDKLKPQIDHAFQKMRERANALKIKGTVVNEAFVDTWYALAHNTNLSIKKNVTAHGIETGSNILFSVINDSLILIFCAILRSILGQTIIIPAENRSRKNGLMKKMFTKKSGERLLNFSEQLVNVHQSSLTSTNDNRENQRAQRISDETFSGIQEIIRVKSKHGSLTLEQIGERAANNLGRNKPFSKSYVSKVLNNWIT